MINYYNYKESDPYNGGEYYISLKNSSVNNVRFQTGDDIIKDTLEIEKLISSDSAYQTIVEDGSYSGINVQYDGFDIEDLDAKEYYIKAYFFSKWVQRNLSDVDASKIKQNISQSELENNKFAYTTDFEGKIFNIDSSDDNTFKANAIENNPENNNSIIAKHKRDIIKNSIQYNLNTAISTYSTSHNGAATEYQLPVLKETDWDSILNNVCMVSFMQGIPCGTQIFNDYAVVKSNNNNTSVSIENLYFTTNIGNEPESTGDTYHKIDCDKLTDSDPNKEYEADQSAEFKYDAKKINSKIKSLDDETIICFYDDAASPPKYYEAVLLPGETERTIDNLYVGQEIVNITNYTAYDGSVINLTKLVSGTELKYLYDHKNEGCYDCIIGGNYTPMVKYYNGNIYATYKTEYGEILIYYTGSTTPKWIYEDGTDYNNGAKLGKDNATDNISSLQASGKMITDAELNRRRKAVYTYMAKIRNNLYKTNSHINR